MGDNLVVANRDTRTYYEVGNDYCIDLGYYKRKDQVLEGKYSIKLIGSDTGFGGINSINISTIENELWQADISQFLECTHDHQSEWQTISMPNTIQGDLMSYDDTVVVALNGGQLLGLNINDGSKKWLLENHASRLNCQNGKYVYSYCWGILNEIEIGSGEIVRKLDLNPFLESHKESIFGTAISNGKLILDFNNNYSNLAVIDLEAFEIEYYTKNDYRSIMLRVFNGDAIWRKNKLYARDPVSKTLYVFEN